ncbi:MAG: site-specific DNA-methyltransferase [Candidatus Thorarchaeota archaeon]|nr:site-specific DNA-methyltransferase [Candidatus Thorarchaeota archaeon]
MEQSTIPDFDSQGGAMSDDWTFERASTNYMTHGLHPYPARMIPQIARKLILRYSKSGETVWDPFCGSGTVLVESMLLERRSIGTDLNPFAIFLSKVKTTPIEPDLLSITSRKIIEQVLSLKPGDIEAPVPPMHNIDYWFKKYVQNDLAQILAVINGIEDSDLRDFFRLCFASTVRDVSNMKRGEFKIVRMRKEKLDRFQPEVAAIFAKHVQRCVPLMKSFHAALADKEVSTPEIFEVDNRVAPIAPRSVDLVVTSPPYGDSATTVAYGQYSKYLALLLGLEHEDVVSVDKRSLGGSNKHDHANGDLESESLSAIYHQVQAKSEKRAKQLLGFFNDLNGSLLSIYDKMRSDSQVCIVLGNRLMSRVRIPTHVIVSELGEAMGFELEQMIPRKIPTKRMPWQNAPENVEGEKADTMHSEHIVVLHKP